MKQEIERFRDARGKALRSMVILFFSKQWMNAKIGDVIQEYRSIYRYSFYKEFGDAGAYYCWGCEADIMKVPIWDDEVICPECGHSNEPGLIRSVTCFDIKGVFKIKILPLDRKLRMLKFTIDDLLLKNSYDGCTEARFMEFMTKLYSRAKTWKGMNTSMMVVNWEITDINKEKFNYIMDHYLTGKDAIDYFLRDDVRYYKPKKEYGWTPKPDHKTWVELYGNR